MTSPDPTSDAAGPRDPAAFARLLREGERRRIGGLPLRTDEAIRAEIREDFGLEPEPRPEIETRSLAPIPISRRLRRVAQALGAIAAVALVFLFVRDLYLPGTAPTGDPTLAGSADVDRALALGDEASASRDPAALPGGMPQAVAAVPTIAEAGVADRLRLAVAARSQRRFDGLDALLASLVVAVDRPVAVASPDLPWLDVAGVEVVPASVRLVPPVDPQAAFGVWQVELVPAVDRPVDLTGWRVAIDLGGLDVVAIGDASLPGFTSPPAYDAATLARGTLLLAAVASTPRSIDGPIVVARLQARRFDPQSDDPMPLEGETVAAFLTAIEPPAP
jgi:hypothetical protein